MHVSGFPFDLNWFLQFIGTAFVVALGLLHLVKNTAPGDSTRLPAIPVPCAVIPRRSSAPDANWSDIVGRSATSPLPQAMFKSFWGSQEQEAQPHPQEIPTNSWYPPSSLSSPSSSRPATPSSSSSSSFNLQRAGDRPQTPSHVSPSEAAGIIVLLKDKSIDELRKLLADKDAYHRFFLSLDQVKAQNNLKDELRKETLQLAGENLEKEPQIMELRNQCRIIRTTELAAAQEKLHELERQKEETLKFYSPASLLRRLQEAMNETDEESEALHRQLLDKEIDVGAFLQKYKKLRNAYHRRALTHLAAKTSLTG